MKSPKYVLGAVLALAALLAPGALRADTDTYDINFATSLGSPTPSTGSFTYDTTDDEFTAFTVTWNGVTYNLLTAANAPSTGAGCSAGASGGAAGFLIMSESISTACGWVYTWTGGGNSGVGFSFDAFTSGNDSITATSGSGAATNTSAFAAGTWTITEVPSVSTTPEPGTLALLAIACLGLAFYSLRRKRLA